MFGLLISACIAGAASPTPAAPKADEVVQRIKEKFKAINEQEGQLQKLERPVMGISAEGARVVGFRATVARLDLVQDDLRLGRGDTGPSQRPAARFVHGSERRAHLHAARTVSVDAGEAVVRVAVAVVDAGSVAAAQMAGQVVDALVAGAFVTG